ncbi:MAG: serine/threonine protein kinase [Clostridia bacterium]|nr:serine/threonine protein kinase [Clostridia bacterium]
MDDSKHFIGATFDGRYKIERVVGIGGMAFVYEATDEQTGGKVALKLLKEKFSDDQRAVKRFINESKSLELLNHTNIVKIHDISVQTKYKYIVMEYINGITLRKYMNYKRPLDWREAVEFTEQIALALDNAHTKGIVHRDIKPQNIMIMQGGKVKVTDFGIAKMPNSESLTMVDKAIGTVYYISPEQASSRKIDARSDIYSLGVMLYEMVTGQMPFTADTPIAVIMKHMNTPPAPPTRLVPAIPKGLEQIILCAMEKNPKNRYQSAAQMLRHLRRLKMDENTLFTIPKPVARTHTSETILKKTARHGSADSAEEANKPGASQDPPPIPKPKPGPKPQPKPKTKPAPPPDATTERLVEPTLPTEKHPLTPEPLPKPKPQPQPKPKPQPQPKPGPKPRPKPQPKPGTKPKPRKGNGMSRSTMLIIIIIMLLFAIVGTLILFFSIGKMESAPEFFAVAEIQNTLLYLKRTIL